MLHQHRVAQAVRQVEETAQAVGHGMHRAEDGVGEGQACLHAAEHDLLAQGDVLRVGDHPHQVAVDQAHGLQRMGVGQRTVASGHECLDGMNQGVDAGTGGEERVHAQGSFRVDQRHIRHHRLADDGELHPFLLVGDDHELRDIRRRTGGGRDQDQRRAGHREGVHALEFENAAAMGSHDADAFGAIHRAAAPHGDDHVAAHAAVEVGPLHHLFHARVGRYLGVQAIVDALGLQAGLDVADPAGGLHTGVGHHQHLARAKGAGVVADIVPASSTENDLGRNELAK
ncbi:hypothetical protein FQZ97_598610 [compost metagenome]